MEESNKDSADFLILKEQLDQLENENQALRAMSISVEDLHDQLKTNRLARQRLKNKVLSFGYDL